ncbi:hypothetical protein [Alteromonas sp. CYL-A6]|uniref:hypothetical protein n=1 Tax=Alteromonas nitratireducens TaxID=3390813 RepID=UPI0034C0C0F7
MNKAIIFLSLLSAGAIAAPRHEVNVGFSDLKDQNDNFIGVQYRHYLQELDADNSAWLIAPYLQRVSSVSGQYFTVNNTHLYNLGATWYADSQWMVSADVTYVDYDENLGDRDDKALDVKVGYNVNRQWQFGAGAFYQRDEVSYTTFDGQVDYSDNEVSPGIFARYTQLDNGQGWDVGAEVTVGDRESLELSSRYFFSPRVSAGATYTHVNGSRGTDQDVLELDVDYWFANGFSLRAGLGVELGDNDGLGSATLLATYRF